MHSLRFLAARALCQDTISQCVDLIQYGPLPRSDVLDAILMLEEAMVTVDVSSAVINDDEFVYVVSRIVCKFTRLFREFR